MASVPVVLGSRRRRQLDDVKDDRLVTGPLVKGNSVSLSDLDGIDDLSDLVSVRVSTGDVEVSEILMCAKCVGECKVF